MPPKKKSTPKPEKTAPAATPTDPAGSLAPWSVRIRMYRKWLGDCFLLTFRNGNDLSHIMIDCGALSGTPAGKDKMRDVAQRIAEETGHHLNALVVTHEHWDHVSGFHDALDIFQTIHIDEVWAAWTEDPSQSVAEEKKAKLTALQLAARHWAQCDDRIDHERGAAMAALTSFLPPNSLSGPLAAFSENTDTAMAAALALGKQTLLNPGDLVQREWLPGVKTYVLGPPKDAGALHDMKGTPDTDMYGGKDTLAAASSAATAAFTGAAAAQLSIPEIPDRFAPFEKHLQWDEPAWRQDVRWPKLAASYAQKPERKIDNDWLNSAAELALQLDSYTNNTSLVLAFELVESKEVLLFVGDAQIGNWLTWTKVKFPGLDPSVDARDLLARTIFYKVGHHGSHNATLRSGGLELMTSDRLVAAIPVDEQFAHLPKGGKKDGWDMPAGPLLKALTEKTKGRVLRADSDFPTGMNQPASLTANEWKTFCADVEVDEHGVNYYVRDRKA